MHRIILFMAVASFGISAMAQSPENSSNKGPKEGRPLPDWAINPGQAGKSNSVSPELQKKAAITAELRATNGQNGARESQLSLRDRALSLAKAKIKTNDLAGAEDVLTVDNPFESGTAHWHLDTAQRWVAVARDLSKEKDRSKVAPVVTRSLQHLDQAADRAREKGDVPSQVTAKSSAAYLHERFRGDIGSAICELPGRAPVGPK